MGAYCTISRGSIDVQPTLIVELLPIGVRGVLYAAFLAALMSSVDSYTNSAATMFCLDVYAPMKKRPMGDGELVTVAKYASIAIALFSYAAAGVAVDLNGLLLGAKLSYTPADMLEPVPDSSVALYEMMPFELSLFGGIALGSHDRHHWR